MFRSVLPYFFLFRLRLGIYSLNFIFFSPCLCTNDNEYCTQAVFIMH